MTRSNLAGRAGAWAAANPKDAFYGWLVFVAVAVALGASAGTKTIPDSASTTGESARAEHTLSQAGLLKPPEEVVFVQLTRLSTPTAQLYSTVRDVAKRLQAQADVQHVRSPLDPQNPELMAWDLRSALVAFRVNGKPGETSKKMTPILRAVADVQKKHPLLIVSEFGPAGSAHALDQTIGKDFRRAEITTVPLTVAILLLAFGALVAAGLPVLLAFSGVLATVGLTAVASHVFPTSANTNAVILMVGMAVGIDYSLFYIRREREERAKGLTRAQALLKTAGTSGHAVLVSGLTVLIAMAGMFFSGSRIFTSFAVGTMLMVAVALLGALTVLPALLSMLGDRVDKGRIKFLQRGRPVVREPRLWSFVLERVLRRPALSAALSAATLVLLSVPALGLHTQFPGFSDLPQSLGLTQTHDRIQTAFANARFVGDRTPAVVVVRAANVKARPVRAGIRRLQRLALASGQMTDPTGVRINSDNTVAAVSISLKGNGNDGASKQALAKLRELIPRTIGRVGGVTTAVTGTTAATSDFNATMSRHMPIVFGFALLLVFVLLLMTFRSIVIPIKAVVLNLLSVGASYGVLVAVFQHTWAEGILGFHSNGAIVSWLPMFLFVILFGISMDYHVFILTRIKELVDDGMDTDEAVAEGIKRTAGVITSAAMVMVAVFSIFATLDVLEMKQMGVGLAAAVLIDATLVRGVLLPATMKLLGDWNWYLPARLEWLPELHRQREVSAAPARAPEPLPDPA